MSKEELLGLVLWIDENKFATDLLEKVFKQKDLPFYTLDNVRDFSFLVEDLKPEMIVLDVKTASRHKELFKAQFDASPAMKNIPFVLIGDEKEFTYVKKMGEIKRPFDPFSIPEVLEKLKTYH
jgi:DNA-binding NtrC family response regulator